MPLKKESCNNQMFLAVYISASYEFCSNGKGSLYTLMLDILNIMDLPIRVASTDRPVSRKKLMKTHERFRHMLFQFDLWHVGKSILKRVIKTFQRKDYKFFHSTTCFTISYALKYDFQKNP